MAAKSVTDTRSTGDTADADYSPLPSFIYERLPDGTIMVESRNARYVAFNAAGESRILPNIITTTMPSFEVREETYDIERNSIPPFILKHLPKYRWNVTITKKNIIDILGTAMRSPECTPPCCDHCGAFYHITYNCDTKNTHNIIIGCKNFFMSY